MATVQACRAVPAYLNLEGQREGNSQPQSDPDISNTNASKTRGEVATKSSDCSASADCTALHLDLQNHKRALAPEILTREFMDLGHYTPPKAVRIAIVTRGEDGKKGELLQLSVVR